jgi:predicted O-methyltransferase YrrM
MSPMGLLKRLVFEAHRATARLGLHVLPRHYYSSVVDLHELEATRASWAKPSTLSGVDWDPDAQERSAREICSPYRDEYAANETFRAAVAGDFGPGYGPTEAQALHAVIRHHRPARIVEVGSGVSTVCMREAVARNRRDGAPAARITCIEPHPSAPLRALEGVELIPRRVQEVDFTPFEALGEGDLLFIDSSHQAKTGSDVCHLFLEVLPRLRPGVVVHIHDIYLPYDYAPFTMKTLWHWNETAFLHAYLIHNPRVRILFCMSLLHHERRAVLAELFPGYDPEPTQQGLVSEEAGALEYPKRHFPAAIFLRTQ